MKDAKYSFGYNPDVWPEGTPWRMRNETGDCSCHTWILALPRVGGSNCRPLSLWFQWKGGVRWCIFRQHSLLCFSNSSTSLWVGKFTQNGPFHSNDWLFLRVFQYMHFKCPPYHPCLSIFLIQIRFHLYNLWGGLKAMILIFWKNQDVSGDMRTFIYGDGSCLEDHPKNRNSLPSLVSPH